LCCTTNGWLRLWKMRQILRSACPYRGSCAHIIYPQTHRYSDKNISYTSSSATLFYKADFGSKGRVLYMTNYPNLFFYQRFKASRCKSFFPVHNCLSFSWVLCDGKRISDIFSGQEFSSTFRTDPFKSNFASILSSMNCHLSLSSQSE